MSRLLSLIEVTTTRTTFCQTLMFNHLHRLFWNFDFLTASHDRSGNFDQTFATRLTRIGPVLDNLVWIVAKFEGLPTCPI
jgi:hypothetical protein